MLKEEVDEEDIAEVVSKWTGVPVSRLMEGEVQKLVRLEEQLHERVVGQADAVTASGQRHPPQPGRAVRPQPADRQLPLRGADRGGQDRAGPLPGRVPVRRRAGHGPHRHERVPGEALGEAASSAPRQASVGYDEGGQLTEEPMRRRPYAVVLLDEIEKAHSDVFNVLLQVLDDGRLTDGQGRTVDFTNVVLIMTSNLPGDPAAFFKPEFINRVDDIVRFRELTQDDLSHIVDLQIATLAQRVAQRRRITVGGSRPQAADDLAADEVRLRLRGSPAQAADPA